MSINTPTLQDLVNTVKYTSDTSAWATVPLDCKTYECRVFEKLRSILFGNSFNYSQEFTYQQTFSALSTFITYLPNNYFQNYSITAVLESAGFFNDGTTYFYDEICCVAKRILITLGQKMVQSQNFPNATVKQSINTASELMYKKIDNCFYYDLSTDYYTQPFP